MHLKTTANQLAEFMTAKTPERRKQIVRLNKYAPKAHPVFYTRFPKRAANFLISGARDAGEVLREIEFLKTRTKSPWFEIDSRITAEALRALIKLAPTIHDLNVEFAVPGANSKTRLNFGDVEVSVTPNLIVHGTRNGKPLVGAMRFYLAKESKYELGKRGAEFVASLEYQWLTKLATGTRTPDADLCMVLECLQQRVTTAPTDTEVQLKEIERGCREFSALWHVIDDKDAA